jgi:hypothetical protein
MFLALLTPPSPAAILGAGFDPCVGGRPGALARLSRQTGNPVRIRDGPAAVSEHDRANLLVEPLAVARRRLRRPDSFELASQKTYQRVSVGLLRGTAATEAALSAGVGVIRSAANRPSEKSARAVFRGGCCKSRVARTRKAWPNAVSALPMPPPTKGFHPG